MADEFLPTEALVPEVPQDPTQAAPTSPAGPPDYKAKRSKFLTKFKEIDPEGVGIDEPTLAEVLADKQKGAEFVTYVTKLNPDFGLSADELASELGYAPVKKKPGGAAASTGGAASQLNPAQMQEALGIRPEDTAQPPVAALPAADAAPSPETVAPAEPLPTAQEYPAYLAAHPDQRAKLIENEAKFLGEVPEGFERTRIPDEAIGPDAPGTYQLQNSPTGQRYIDRPLSKVANGQEQTEWEAAGANFKNQLLEMGQGGLDYLGAADRRLRDSPMGQFADELGAKVGLNGDPNRANVYQEGADALDSKKSEVAPFHQQSKFTPGNPATYPMALSNVAALAAPAIASVLLPEGRVAQALQTVASVGFDAQMLEGSFNRARAAGLTPGSPEYDNYTLLDGAATMLVFKLGGQALGAAQGAALRSQLVQTAAAELRGVAGSVGPELLGKAMQRAAQTVKAAAGEGAQMGTLMAASTVKDKVGERLANQEMGRAVFPQQSLGEDAADVGRSFGEGVVLGGLTGGIRGAGQPVGAPTNPRTRPFEGTKPVPAELPVGQLRGRKVLTRDAQGHAQLGEVQDVVNAPEGRTYVVRDGAGKLSRHAQGEVFQNDRATQPKERTSSLPQVVVDKMPVPSGLQTLAAAQVLDTPRRPERAGPSAPATDPGPTADNQPRRPATPRPTEVPAQPATGPTLAELVPDATPVTLDFGGEPVQAFRNEEGDVELHHQAGNISVISKGEAFDKPAVVSSLTRPKARVKAGDTVTLGSGDFATELPIEDVQRNQAGQIEAVMVQGQTSSRIIEGDTPEGKAALADLNAREQQEISSVKFTDLKNPTDTASTTPNSPADSNTPKLEELEKPKTPAYGTPAENRKAGSFTKDGQTYTRQQPLAERVVEGNETTVHFATGEAQPGRFALVEAADLQPSHMGGSQNLTHFLPEAQPKNRSAAFDRASQKSIDEIAATPDAKQLGDAPTAYAGAPVVNSRGEVIQGNGRSEGIRQHYKQGGKTYRAEILSEAQRVGIDPTAARAMKEPVLVRVADVSDARAQQLGSYTAADTESGGTRRLDVKQAAQRLNTDSRADLARILTPEGEGTLTETIRSKQAELVRFLQKNKLANATQLQTLVKADGSLTPQGVEDVTALHRQTLFADADPNLPELFQELPAAAQNGLDRAVGHLASLSEQDSILPELHAALAGVREYKAGGTDFATWAGQRDLYAADGKAPSEKYNPLELKLIKLLADEKRPTYISRVFDQYARAVKGQEGDLFTGQPAVPRAEAITQTFQVTDEQPRRNASRTQGAPGLRPADGPPAAPDARAVQSPAENAQRGTQLNAANSERPGAGRAARQQLTESKKAKIQASIDEAAERIKQRRAARQQEGKLFSSPLGIGEIDPEDLKDALTIAKGHIKLGALKVKALVAKIREAGLDEQAAPTEALRPHLKKLLAKQESAAIATKERRHAARYDEATRSAFTSDEARYAPKKLIENAATARDYIHQVGLENAYSVALDKPDGFAGAAHVELQEAVATEYRRLSDEARKAGDKTQAEAYWRRAKDVRAKKVNALTDAAQTLSQAQTLIADSPESVLDAAIKTTEQQRKPLLAKAEKEGVKVAGQAIKARRRAMRATLNSDTVRAAREVVAPTTPAEEKPTPEPTGYGLSNKYFNKAKAQQAKEALRKLGLSTIVPPELVNFVGYHVEALARAGGKHSFAEVSKRVVRDLGARVKPLLPEAYEQARAKYLKNGGAGSEKGFTSPEDVAKLVAPQAVKAGIKQLGTTLDKIAREHAEGVNMKGQTLAERFVGEAGIDPKQAKVYADAVEAEYAKQITARKKELAHRVVNFTTRVLLGRNAATAVDRLLSTLNLATNPASAGELLKAQLKLPDITPEQADHFTKLAEAVRTARPGNDRANRVTDLMKALGKLENVSYYQAAESVWYASVLSGPLTHAGNLAGNAKQATAEAMLSVMHTFAETGDIRAAISPVLGAVRAQRRAIAEATRIIKTGYVGSQPEKFGHSSVLENANNSLGLKYVGRALAGEDAYFNFTLRGMRTQEVALKQAYKEVTRAAAFNNEKLALGETYHRAQQEALGKLFGIADLRAAAESQATAEGLTDKAARERRIGELVNEQVEKRQAQWEIQAEQEGLSGAAKHQRVGELQEQAQPADLVADAKQFAELGTYNSPQEGTLGAVADLIGTLGNIPVAGAKPFKLLAPFARILSNVGNRRLDWTGVGILRAVKGSTGSKDYMGGKFHRELTPEQREKAYLSGTLGTVTMLGAYAMAKAGYLTITGTGWGDKDENKIEPPASIRWGNSDLFISYQGGVNELGFAAIGNIIDWQAREEKAGRKVDPTKRLMVAAGLTAMYTAEISPAQGVSEGLENLMGMAKNPDRAGSYVARMATNTGKGLIPWSAAIQQSLRGLNIIRGESEKEAISSSAWQTAYNSLVADVPVVRDEQRDALDILGRPLRLDSHRLWGYRTERSAEDQKALDFLAENELLPARKKATDPSLSVYNPSTGKMQEMNADQFYLFQRERGKAFGELLRAAMKRPSENPAYTPEMRALLAKNPNVDRSLPEMDIPTAKKRVAALHKQAVAQGKAAVFAPTTAPAPTK